MSAPDGAGRQPVRRRRSARQAVSRLRWGRRIVLWAAPADPPSRQRQLDVALARLPRRFRVVRIPYGAMPAGEICALALAALDRSLAGDPERDLLAAVAARGARRGRLVLAIEEADHMPVAEARRLQELAARAAGALRILVVASPGPDEERLRDALASRPGRQPRRPGPAASRPAAGVAGLRRPDPPARALSASSGGAPRETGPAPFTYTAADQALEALARRLLEGSPLVAVVGPPGIGKTVVMRRLAKRLGDAFEPVWVPGMALPADELLRWIVYCRTGSPAPIDSLDAWRREMHRANAAGRPMLILLDDAGALLPDAAAALAAETERAEGALRIALSLCEGRYRGEDGVARLRLQAIRLDAPLTPGESIAFLRAQLGSALDATLLARVVEEARGVPAALLRGATGWLARRAALLRSAAPPAGP